MALKWHWVAVHAEEKERAEEEASEARMGAGGRAQVRAMAAQVKVAEDGARRVEARAGPAARGLLLVARGRGAAGEELVVHPVDVVAALVELRRGTRWIALGSRWWWCAWWVWGLGNTWRSLVTPTLA